MAFDLIGFQSGGMTRYAVQNIVKCNDFTEQYGLVLTQRQAAALQETRMAALQKSGRVELGGGVVEKLIYAFCDSPYLTKESYESVLHTLTEVFYYYKNEMLDRVTDDELIRLMRKYFDRYGSTEWLIGTALERMAQNIRAGRPIEEDVDDNPPPEGHKI